MLSWSVRRSDTLTQCKTVPTFGQLAKTPTHSAYNFHTQMNSFCWRNVWRITTQWILSPSQAEVTQCKTVPAFGHLAFCNFKWTDFVGGMLRERQLSRCWCGCCYPLWPAEVTQCNTVPAFGHPAFCNFATWSNTFWNLNKDIFRFGQIRAVGRSDAVQECSRIWSPAQLPQLRHPFYTCVGYIQ